jgi:broad specificity phosphatase PhoE
MSPSAADLPKVYLARHGETEWTKTRQHTGRTDIPLTPAGEDDARLIGRRLAHLKFTYVVTSPLRRARRTCELAGFPAAAIDPDLQEWDYGEFEGLTSVEIKARKPDWDLFRDGGPGGETPAQIADRAERVAAQLKKQTGNVLVFAHGHYLRVLAARWCRADVSLGRRLLLGTSSISVLWFDHNTRDEPAIMLWNDDRHLSGEGCLLPLQK